MQNTLLPQNYFNALKSVFDELCKIAPIDEIQVLGGLTGRIYGSKRPLNNIDINVKKDVILKICSNPKFATNIDYSPAEYEDEEWKMFVGTLKIGETIIDLRNIDEQYIKFKGTWQRVDMSIDQLNLYKVAGELEPTNTLEIPLMSPEKYIAYKKLLRWPKHRLDESAAINFLKRK